MKTSVALLSLAGAVLATAPSESSPSGCSKEFSGNFEVTIGKLVSKRDVLKRGSSCGTEGILLASLADGVLTDSKGRIGYIASNYQFQFDNPVQDGTIYDSGFSVCGNNTLALGASTTWYQCKSGSFWNLYDRNWAPQCEAVEIIVLPCDDSGASASVTNAQIVATELVTTTIVKPLSDGQPQVITTAVPVPICQIGDGQIQGHSTPCASITVEIPTPATTAVPVSQYSDGQIQVTSPAPAASTAATTAAVTTPAAPGTTAPAPTTKAATTPAETTPAATTPAATTKACHSCGTSLKTVVSVKSSANVTSQASIVTGTASSTAALTTAAAPSASSTVVVASGAIRAVGSFGALAAGLAVAFFAL